MTQDSLKNNKLAANGSCSDLANSMTVGTSPISIDTVAVTQPGATDPSNPGLLAGRFSQHPTAVEARARRAANRLKLAAIKSRIRNPHHDNRGGFMLFDRYNYRVVDGIHYDLSAEDVIHLCEELTLSSHANRGAL